MKNIQIIDGAVNSVFEVYEVSDELFELMFPGNSDIAFMNEVDELFQRVGGDQKWELVYRNKVDKKHVLGIHGTLHLTGSYCEMGYYPSRKEAEVLQNLKKV
jgi:hypothetical protein